MVLKLITAPSGLVLSVAELKERTGIFHSEKDDAIQSYIEAATEDAERYTGRQLLTATWEVHLPGWQKLVELKKCPVKEIVSIKYFDSNNAEQELNISDAEKVVYSIDAEPAAIHFKEWFDTYDRFDAIKIRYTAGYGTGNIPKSIVNAIAMAAAKSYETPSDTVENLPKASKNLLRQYRI